MIDLTDKVALVTGSSRGIGRTCALRLAEAGADVVVNYLTSQRAARDTSEAIQKLGRRTAVIKADVSEPDDVAAMVEFVGKRFGRLDVVVSNVASGGFREIVETSPEHLEAALRTNVTALVSLVRSALPLLERQQGRAKVVALSSHGSRRALPAYGVVGVTKAALESLVRQLALELGNRGINFNVVLAGLVETDSTRGLPNRDDLFRAVEKRLLVGDRHLLIEDIADGVLFLASPLSDLVQGQILVVDGGFGIHG